jgi:hypothetical protein
MTFKFRPAVREQTSVMIGLAGPSSSGKTYSALRLATGMANGAPIFFIDTESRRALHYADKFKFEHGELVAPFRPSTYLEAMEAAKKAGAKVIVIDSMSHEHEGPGGILEWHEEELTRMAGEDWNKRERMKFTAWIKPKREHNKYVNSVLQLGVHVIFCFRAKEKLKLIKNSNGKLEPTPQGWQPICAERFEFEMLALLMLPPNSQGKIDLEQEATKLQGQHAGLFPQGAQISEEMGQRIAAWAAGGKVAAAATKPTSGATGPTAGATETKPETKRGTLILRSDPAVEGRACETAGDWLDGLAALLNGASSPDQAQQAWELNEDTFHRISKAANSKKNEALIERCKAVGKLAFDKRTPPTEGPDPGPAARPTAGINATKAAAEIMGKIVRAGSLQLLSAIEHDYAAELLTISQANPDKHAEIMSALDGKRQHFRGAR